MKRAVLLTIFLWQANVLAANGKASVLKPLHLIELFTSQGCSSCPPADRWLYKMGSHKKQYMDYVSISFHVDYWNYLGWRDPFSSKKYSQRQRSYVKQGFFDYVATPTILLNGKPYREWRRNPAPPALKKPNLPAVTVIKKGNLYQISWPHFTGDDRLWLQGTLLSKNMTVNVKSGENAGRSLKHDHVALGLQQSTIAFDKKTKTYKGSIVLKNEINRQIGIEGYALWISKVNQNKPIIAVAERIR